MNNQIIYDRCRKSKWYIIRKNGWYLCVHGEEFGIGNSPYEALHNSHSHSYKGEILEYVSGLLNCYKFIPIDPPIQILKDQIARMEGR